MLPQLIKMQRMTWAGKSSPHRFHQTAKTGGSELVGIKISY